MSFWRACKCFNSRTREGCDFRALLVQADGDVSIHAPARGAMYVIRAPRFRTRFNSRTREGCDDTPEYKDKDAVFQFTHPRGVR